MTEDVLLKSFSIASELWAYRLGKKQNYVWVFPKIGVPQNGWFLRENPITIDDLEGPPLFLETPI